MKLLLTFILVVLAFTSCQRTSNSAVHQADSIWKPYSKQAALESIKHNKPIIIDFYADWCPNCHDLDRTVFSRADVQAKLAKVTALRMDVTNQDDPQVQQIIQEYDIEGVPTVILFDGKGREIPESRVMGLVTPEEFLQALGLMGVLK